MNRWGLPAVLVLTIAVSAWAMRPRPNAHPPGLPKTGAHAEWVTSSACKRCHPGEHASWHRTWHRTMTQIATPDTVLAPLERRGEEVWLPEGRVVMTTGSHHEQTYWLQGAKDDLVLAPVVWIKDAQKLIPRADAFLRPPDAPMPVARWNSNCIQCHATGGEPRFANGHFETEAAELGIACEACHGPGGEHVRKHGDPIERWIAWSDGKRDTSIVNPAKLEHDRSAAVCGQCHSYAYPRDESAWWKTGYVNAFRPGQAFDEARILLSLDTLQSEDSPLLSASDDSIYWPDGTIRVAGREYNGMVMSACFTKGTLACTSCHAMHAGDPDDQIAPDKLGDAMCTGCHTERAPAHTKHAVGSTGSRCVECHMPMTSYALFTAIRTHRIQSPREDNRVSACVLCHLDKPAKWSDGIPAAAALALRGDAAERALAAAAMGRKEALDASGRDWEKPILEALRDDPYAAVRTIAARSVKETSGSRVLVGPDVIRREIARRDDHPVTIAE